MPSSGQPKAGVISLLVNASFIAFETLESANISASSALGSIQC